MLTTRETATYVNGIGFFCGKTKKSGLSNPHKEDPFNVIPPILIFSQKTLFQRDFLRFMKFDKTVKNG